MLREQLQAHLVEPGLDGADLGQDVDAVALVLDHALDAPHLALDALEARREGILVGDVAGLDLLHVAGLRSGWKRRSRRELATTKRLEPAMAAPAISGLR